MNISFRLLFVCVMISVLGMLLLVGCPGTSSVPGDPSFPGDDAADSVLWLRFGLVGDTHITDSESPARQVRVDNMIMPAAGSWRPQEEYAPHVLDATVRLLNDIHAGDGRAARPLDFVMFLGDATDNAHYNELRWFVDVVDGRPVLNDSGEPDGRYRDVAREDNPKLSFQPEGLDVPWYVLYGNHDALAAGVFAIDRSAENPLDWFAPIPPVYNLLVGVKNMVPTASVSPAVIDGLGAPMLPETYQLDLKALRRGTVVPDDNRRFISKMDFMAEFFNSESQPSGHGFTDENLEQDKASYSFRPKADVPVRFVVLDTVAKNPYFMFPAHYGSVTVEQLLTVLKPEFDAAKAAGEYVILFTHHPSEDFNLPGSEPLISTGIFRKYLTEQPNMLAHFCGHTHLHKVNMIEGTYSYPEIQTAALIDSPQEGRIIEVRYDAGEEAVLLSGSAFSHIQNPTRLSETSHTLAEIDAVVIEAYGGQSVSDDAKALEDFYDIGPVTDSSAKSCTELPPREFVLKLNRPDYTFTQP